MTTSYPVTHNTKITRLRARGTYDKQTIYKILDEALFCTLSYVADYRSFQIPTGFCRIGNVLYVHGSTHSSYLQMILQKKLPISISVTLIDGIVLARSLFSHSMNYRSVVIFSKPKPVTREKQAIAVMKNFTEKMCPGRWKDARLPTAGEWKATQLIGFPILEASAKIRTGPPIDQKKDHDMDVWAGVLPLTLEQHPPIPDPSLKRNIKIPKYILRK